MIEQDTIHLHLRACVRAYIQPYIPLQGM